MTAVHPQPSITLALFEAIDRAHREADLALDGHGTAMLDAVAWLSAHLAAVDHAVHPIAVRVLPDARVQISAQRNSAHHLQHSLWLLDRRLTGDTHTSRLAVEPLVADVRTRLDEHTRGEHDLLAALAGTLTAADVEALTAAYTAAVDHAPTRPHPLNPDRPGLRGIAFRLDAIVDRVRDLLDNRHAPTRRPRRPPRAPGKWGLYLLGSGGGRENPDGSHGQRP